MLVKRTTLHKMGSYTKPVLHLKSISVSGVTQMHLPRIAGVSRTHLWWIPKAFLVPLWSISDWYKNYLNCISDALLCIFAQSALRLYLKHISSKSQVILNNSHVLLKHILIERPYLKKCMQESWCVDSWPRISTSSRDCCCTRADNFQNIVKPYWIVAVPEGDWRVL